MHAPNGRLARYSNVRMPSGPLPGPGNLSADPRFVDPAGDLRLASDSPCIDAGDPMHLTLGVDVNGDPRYLDGNLDGLLAIDMGASEHLPVRLAITGTVAAGEVLTFETTGVQGLKTFLAWGTYSESVIIPGIGVFLIDPTQPLFHLLKWFPTPSTFETELPPGLPVGLALTYVQLAFGGGAVVPTNAVTLQF